MNKPIAHPWWDAFCVASIVGIWPRYCEPRMLTTNYVTLKIKDLPSALQGLKILQFSDLHLNPSQSDKFLEKVKRKAEKFAPDIAVFTGDFICQSKLDPATANKLLHFLTTFPRGRYGSFAILGNHDYAEFVSVNSSEEYSVTPPTATPFMKGLKRAFSRTLTPKAMQRTVHDVPLHQELLALLSQTPFRLLHNACATVPIQGSALNIAGLGEYMLGRFDPENAFKLWDYNYPGIVLAHNPDCVPHLTNFPGAVILAGHTHGAQINVPLVRKRFLCMENPQYKQGMIHVSDKWLYVNRGLGALMPFRWFAPPELLCLTLVPA